MLTLSHAHLHSGSLRKTYHLNSHNKECLWSQQRRGQSINKSCDVQQLPTGCCPHTLLSLWNRLYGAFFACIINYGRVNHLLMLGRFLASHYFIVANPPRTVVYDAISVAFTVFCSFSLVLSSRLTLLSHTCSVPFFIALTAKHSQSCLYSILTMYCGLWLPESNPPLAFPSVVVFCVWGIAGTWPL